MAFLGQAFNANELPQSTTFEPLPAGWYQANIKKADITQTKDGNGQYIKVQYEITGPSHQGRLVFGNLNIKNASPKAEEIGRQQLGEIMRAIGLLNVTDTDQLIGGNLLIKLDIRPANDKYEAQNEVRGFKSANGSMPPVQLPRQASPTGQDATGGKSAPPWAFAK